MAENLKTKDTNQSNADLSNLVTSLSDKVSQVETKLTSMSDKMSNIDTFAQNVNRILEVIDIGQDEAFKSDIFSESSRGKDNKQVLFNNLKRTVDSYLTHESDMDRLKYDTKEERLDKKAKLNAADDRQGRDIEAFKFILMMKAATGVDTLNPKDAITLLESVRNA